MRRAFGSFALLVACTDAVDDETGVNEPMQVPDGTFRRGQLREDADGPTVTSLDNQSGIVHLGQVGRMLGGRLDDDAWAVGVRFASLGSGWWIHGIQDLDPIHPGERGFELAFDVGGGVPPGLHAVRVAAIDQDGGHGPPLDFDVCVIDERIPDGLNACDPTLPPPAIVLVATWDRPVDLDLVVELPDGDRVSWKRPTTADAQDGVVPDEALDDPTVGRLDRDSNAGCLADGRNAEAVVWAEPPLAGTYSAYVDLFDACGELDVTFTVAVYRARDRGDGTLRLEETDRRTGTLVPTFYADGGTEPPLYVMSTELP